MHSASSVLIVVIFTFVLCICGWQDFRDRKVSLPLLILLMVLPAVLIAKGGLNIETSTSEQVLVGITLLVIALWMAGIFGVADVLATTAVTLLLAGEPSTHMTAMPPRVLALTVLAVAGWSAHRMVKSVRISGLPRNAWDWVSLLFARHEVEREWLPTNIEMRFQDGRSRMILLLEINRTPDGHHLCTDPCPVVSCIAMGWSCSLAWSIFQSLFIGT